MKKKLLSLLLAGALLVSMSGCGSDSGENEASKSGGEITLEFWNPFTGSDGTIMNELVENFNAEHEGEITVNVQTMESGDYYAKIPTVFSSGTDIPDVVILHVERLPYYSQKGMIEPMDEDIESMGLAKEDFISATWDAGVMEDGQRYSLPLDTHMWELYYNQDILTELGYSEADLEGMSKEKFMEICKAAVDKGYVGCGLYWPGINSLFYGLLNQFGGSYADPADPETPLFNSEAGIQAAEFIKEMQDAGLTNEVGSDQESLFKAGTELFCSTGIWSNTGFGEIDGLNYGQMFFPEIGEKPGNMANSHNLAIMKQPEADEAQHEACVEFIKYLSDNSVKWAAAGQVPARLDALESEEFAELPWAFAADNLDAFSFLPACVTASDMDGAVSEHLQKYYNGEYSSAEEALAAAEKQAAQLAKETVDSL